ncbi:hypothetical protein [Streptomyces sp. NPDC053431]|uniref:hypothetical protein n=1 Tax=Streptomyces sp. NPDC053431 TaxID=3365703 RepID=UPI0037D6E9F4
MGKLKVMAGALATVAMIGMGAGSAHAYFFINEPDKGGVNAGDSVCTTGVNVKTCTTPVSITAWGLSWSQVNDNTVYFTNKVTQKLYDEGNGVADPKSQNCAVQFISSRGGINGGGLLWKDSKWKIICTVTW